MVRIVLVGAGSLQFGAGMLGDIFQSAQLNDVDIVLNDINEAAAHRTLEMAEKYVEANNLPHHLRVETDLAAGLRGADFVVISIEVGDRFALWDLDWRIPQQYGVQQVYGENGGPGGLFHSLRIIPEILKICEKVLEISPNATVFNYSNPMSRICTTVTRVFPDLQFIGMCHEIASLERHLSPLLGLPRDSFRYRAAGLNHFSVLASITNTRTNENLYEQVLAKAPDYFSNCTGYSEIYNASRSGKPTVETESWAAIDESEIEMKREWSDRWLFREVLEHFRVLPITGDSHFGEYIQWAHDASDHRGILDFYTYYRHHLGNNIPSIRSEIHERVIPIIDAMVSGARYEEAAVNIPNSGFIPCLPDWIAVEVPASISTSGPVGIPVDLPIGFQGLLTNQIGVHQLTAEAIVQRSRELAIQALLVDPVVSVSKSIPQMVDHIIAEQQPWLDYLR